MMVNVVSPLSLNGERVEPGTTLEMSEPMLTRLRALCVVEPVAEPEAPSAPAEPPPVAEPEAPSAPAEPHRRRR